MAVPQLTEDEREWALSGLPEWSLRDDKLAIVRKFKFADFSEAFAFMARVALIAENVRWRDAEKLADQGIHFAIAPKADS